MSLSLADLYLPSLADIRQDLTRDHYKLNPVQWVSDTLSESMWSRQQEIFNSIRDNRRTAVHSCHSSGKSWTASRVTAWWLSVHKPGEAFVVTSAPTGRQVRAILWREIGRAHAFGNLPGRTNQTEWWMPMPAGNEEMVAFGQKPADMDPSAFQGIHQRYVLVIFDEACGIHQDLWNAADTLISNENSRFLAIGNPDDPTSYFASVCSPGSGWSVIKISAFDTPNFTNEPIPPQVRDNLVSPVWVDEKRRAWGEDSPMYISKVLGTFPEYSEDGLIPMAWITAARERVLPTEYPVELGVDVGGGGDRSVIAVRRGAVVRILRKDDNPDTMQTCGNVVQSLTATGASVAKVDEIGIGRGVVDRAKELNKPVTGINVGQPAEDKDSFANLRAEGYWRLRERFQEGTIDLDPDDDDLAAQLADIKYFRTSTGKIQIESKKDMVRRGVSSPDEADAVMLAFLTKTPKRHVPATWGRKIN